MKTILLTLLVGVMTAACSTARGETSRIESFNGMCDASAVVALNRDLFIVGDDEDSVLRVYSRARGGLPIQRLNTTAFLGFAREDEADFEGAARIGDRIFWITSHGNNRKGKEQESRQRFFAVTVSTNSSGVRLQPIGRAYSRLLDDLLADPRLRQFQLAAAVNLAPKTPGALNIEGLAATPEGHLLIGFRNPVPRGQALIVPLLNPNDLLAGRRARFGDPILINLRGHGIRSIERWQDRYLIVAGSVDGRGKSRLFEWSGGSEAPRPLEGVDFPGFNPEAISVINDGPGAELLVVSDDGTRQINGEDCKRLKDPAMKAFRAMTVPLAPGLAHTN